MRALTLACIAALAACSTTDNGPAGPSTLDPSAWGPQSGEPVEPGEPAEPGDTPAGDSKLASRTSDLQWKRYAAFEADLAGALDLPREEVCRELGEAECIREVHLTPLGGNEPFESGLLKPSQEPLATTPTVVDRIVLAACSKRADLDAASGSGPFAKQLDLSGDAPEPASEAIHATVVDLYRRLLARDPSEEEIMLVGSLARDDGGTPVAAVDFAKAACFAIGTHTEFLFF